MIHKNLLPEKLDYINAIRGLAIIGVLMVHTKQYGKSNLSYTIANLIESGSKGVQLFYLASAFTLFLSFKNRMHKEKFPIKNFFIRRFFRIAPLYYLGILYYLFQGGIETKYWLGDQQGITVANIISNVTFLHGFNPYWINSIVPGGWSIAVEMCFYGILPFLFFRIKKIQEAFNLFLFALLLQFILHIILIKFPLISFHRLWIDYLYFYFPNQLPVFCLGIIMYFIVIEKQGLKELSGKSLLLFSSILLAELSSGATFIFPSHIFFALVFLLLGISLNRYPFILIVNPIVNYIGKISFSMYLVHFAVLHWLQYFQFTNLI